MMGLEEETKERKVNHTPTIALGVAALLLLIVGAISYRDYIRNKYGAPGTNRPPAGYGQPNYYAQGQPNYANYPQNGQPQQNYGQPGYQPPQAPGVGPNGQPGYQGQPAYQPPAPKKDPEIEELKKALAKLQEAQASSDEEKQRLKQKADEAQQALEKAEREAQQPSGITDNLLASPDKAPENDFSGEESISELRDRLSQSPALAVVLAYDKDWGTVIFNAGSSSGVKEGSRFSIRREGTIVGVIKVETVEPIESLGRLVSGNRNSETAMKPQQGDEVIAFDPF
ncbi:MAG: hypothetical protein AAF226_05285 [Verrucomicrobiota bacterium]